MMIRLAPLISKIFWFFEAVFEGKLFLAKHRNGFLWVLSVDQSGVDTLGNYQTLVSNELLGVKMPPQKGRKANLPSLSPSSVRAEELRIGFGLCWERKSYIL